MTDLSVRTTPLVQFDADDPTLLTRWMARVPRRVRKAMHQRIYHLSHRDRLNAAAKRYYRDHKPEELAKAKARYERNARWLRAEARARYHKNVKASRAKLRKRYAANRELFKQRELERYYARKRATAILIDVLAYLDARLA